MPQDVGLSDELDPTLPSGAFFDWGTFDLDFGPAGVFADEHYDVNSSCFAPGIGDAGQQTLSHEPLETVSEGFLRTDSARDR